MLLSYPLLKAAALPLLTAVAVGSCTASYFHIKIDNLELEWRAQVAQAETKAMAVVVEQQKITEDSERAYQTQIADLRSRYADAADRLRVAAKARRMSVVSNAASEPNGPAAGSGLLNGDGTAGAVTSLQVPVDGTVALLAQCDENTQKLLGLQTWINLQLKLGEEQ